MKIGHTYAQRRAIGIEEEKSNRCRIKPIYIKRKEKRQIQRSGAIKTYTCKQCGFISETKEEQWIHIKIHIPKEKQLNCTKCLFVTEYKHHMTYHERNHSNFKPFNCNKCKYSCVNNSMLISHMKYFFEYLKNFKNIKIAQ